MPSTVEDLIDQLFDEWLEPASEQPFTGSLAVHLTDSATTLTYDDTYLPPEYLHLLSPGSLVEIDRELIRVGSRNTSTMSLLRRGVGGTVAVAHDIGTPIKINPRFTRHAVFSMVVAAVNNLWPPLYDVNTVSLGVGPDAYAELPADFVQPISAIASYGGEYMTTPARILNPFPAARSHKAAYFPGVDGTVMLSYRRPPLAPTSEDDVLEQLGIRPSWHRIIKVDVLLDLASNTDLLRLNPNTMQDRTELELNPTMALSEIRTRLVQYRQYLVQRAESELEHEFGAILSVQSDGTFT